MKTADQPKISIVGAGRLGGALAVALDACGYPIVELVVRDAARAEKIARAIGSRPQIRVAGAAASFEAEVVLIATQDFAIAEAAAQLGAALKNARPVVLHTSGALSSEILAPLRALGCPTGSLHPLVSVSDALLGAERFRDAYFCVEGEPAAVAVAERLVDALGGRSFSIAAEHKALYHAAAVTACGHLVALVETALEMLRQCGLDEPAARRTLLPLIRGTVENLAVQPPAEALTGPFARADVGTFARHLEALAAVSPQAREIYLQLGARSTHLAETRGADARDLAEIRRQISLAKKNLKC